MNTPYVKQYDHVGKLLNPIKGAYESPFPNRRSRREDTKKNRFYGESKNHHLTVMKTGKYLRHKQVIFCANGERRVIEHYLLQS